MAMAMAMAVAIVMAMAMAMAMAPQVVPCADKNKTTLKTQTKHFCNKNTNIERIRPRDHDNLIDLDERIFLHLTRAP